MAGQCNNCSGTGKCPTCSGRGEVEASEPRSFRGTRLHRFEFPGPQFYGIWRYESLSVVKWLAKPMTESEMVAKGESESTSPECAEDKICPCSVEYWRPCAMCHKPVCERHDYLVPVWPPESGAWDPADMLCKDCVAALWFRGDISQGSRVQYVY